MKKSFLLTAVVSLISIALSALFFTMSNGTFAAQASGDKKIHVIEHAITDTTVDLGPTGPSRGDILAFANPVFDQDNKKQVGSDNGHCILTDPNLSNVTYECFWTVILPKGQITVEGPFFSAADSVLAITGGTGFYRGARGEMKLHARNAEGTEYDFIYTVVG
jgi:allene oxide cyclase